MEFDAFTAGVNPGGLRSTTDIKILICYIISSIKPGISKNDIVMSLQESNLANYFEITDAFSYLESTGSIQPAAENRDIYTITDNGEIIANQLVTALPISIREKALLAAVNLMAKVKRETENTVTIEPTENGYLVNCNISGGDISLMSIGMYLPDKLQSAIVQENFQKSPGIFYECILALLTKDYDLVANALKEIESKLTKK